MGRGGGGGQLGRLTPATVKSVPVPFTSFRAWLLGPDFTQQHVEISTRLTQVLWKQVLFFFFFLNVRVFTPLRKNLSVLPCFSVQSDIYQQKKKKSPVWKKKKKDFKWQLSFRGCGGRLPLRNHVEWEDIWPLWMIPYCSYSNRSRPDVLSHIHRSPPHHLSLG